MNNFLNWKIFLHLFVLFVIWTMKPLYILILLPKASFCFFLINWITKLDIKFWFSLLHLSWDIKPTESMYWKYNLFFDLKTKRILKIFHISFFNFITKIEKEKNFLKLIFWFEIKKGIRKFWYFFLESGFKSK